ncbi:MAG: antibiotic biosynthesis monooxygenase [Ignavibacteria bacterium]
MVKAAILVRLEAKPGKEKEVEDFLNSGLGLVQEEPDTITWYALKFGKSSYAIFDTFNDEDGINAHLNGKVAEALMAKAADLFSNELSIEKADVIVSKLPE